jgi:hypothetical protein
VLRPGGPEKEFEFLFFHVFMDGKVRTSHGGFLFNFLILFRIVSLVHVY